MDDTSAKELFVLGRVSVRPTHGHEIMRTLYESRSDLWVDLSKKHVYYILKKLERDGLVSSAQERTGNLPARTIYAITRAGQAALTHMVQAESLIRSMPYSEFDVVFGMLAYTDAVPDDVKSAVLARRRDYLREVEVEGMRLIEDARSREGAGGVQRVILEKVVRMARAESGWLDDVERTLSDHGWASMRPVVTAASDEEA